MFNIIIYFLFGTQRILSRNQFSNLLLLKIKISSPSNTGKGSLLHVAY